MKICYSQNLQQLSFIGEEAIITVNLVRVDNDNSIQAEALLRAAFYHIREVMDWDDAEAVAFIYGKFIKDPVEKQKFEKLTDGENVSLS